MERNCSSWPLGQEGERTVVQKKNTALKKGCTSIPEMAMRLSPQAGMGNLHTFKRWFPLESLTGKFATPRFFALCFQPTTKAVKREIAKQL